MKALVEDWRAKFHASTLVRGIMPDSHDNVHASTDAQFPFGWCQLNSNGRASAALYTASNSPKNKPGHGARGDDPYGAWQPPGGFESVPSAGPSL